MSFDIATVLQAMVTAAGEELTTEAAKVRSCFKTALEEEKQALKDIATERLNGTINDQDVESHLASEKVALETALLECKVKSRVALQKALNAAIDVFTSALTKAISAI